MLKFEARAHLAKARKYPKTALKPRPPKRPCHGPRTPKITSARGLHVTDKTARQLHRRFYVYVDTYTVPRHGRRGKARRGPGSGSGYTYTWGAGFAQWKARGAISPYIYTQYVYVETCTAGAQARGENPGCIEGNTYTYIYTQYVYVVYICSMCT